MTAGKNIQPIPQGAILLLFKNTLLIRETDHKETKSLKVITIWN